MFRTFPGELLEEQERIQPAVPAADLDALYSKEAALCMAGNRRYHELAPLFDSLYDGSVVLLRGSWLVEQCRSGGVLPRRQELPPDATWNPEELWCAYQSWSSGPPPKIMVVSHRWMSLEHPDPDGGQLQTLATALAHSHEAEGRGRDTAVFYDWCSLCQQPYGFEEYDLYERATTHLDLWFMHERTHVLLLSYTPPHVMDYLQRGWPCLEVALTRLRPPASARAVFELGLDGRADAWSTTSSLGKVELTGDDEDWWERPTIPGVPLPPTVFSEELQQKHFALGATDRIRAFRIYERAFYMAFAQAQVLDYRGLGWGSAHAGHLAISVMHCDKLRRLDISGNVAIGDPGIVALTEALGCLGESSNCLEAVCLNSVGLTDRGARMLAQELPRCRGLKEVHLKGNQIGDQGARWLASAVAACVCLQRLSLSGNPIGAEGSRLLQQAWSWAAWCTSAGKDLRKLVVGLRSSGAQEDAMRKLSRFVVASEKNRFAIARAGAIPLLVRLLGSDTGNLQLQAAATLQILAAEGSGAIGALVRESGGIPPLLQMLRGLNAATRVQAAAALRSLGAQSVRSNLAIVRTEGVEAFLQLLFMEPDEQVQQQLIGILGNLTATTEVITGIVAEEQTPAVVELLSSTAPGVRAGALGMLRSLTSLPGGTAAIREAGGIPALVWMLCQWTSSGLPEEVACCDLLRTLAEDADCVRILAQVEAVGVLLDLLAHTHPRMQEHSAAILSSLISYSVNIRRTVLETGGVSRLVDMLASEEEPVQHQAASVLRNLAVDFPECRRAMAEAGGIRHLVRLLSSNTLGVQKLAVGAVRSMCMADDDAKVAVMEAGGVPHLVRMCGAEDSPE